MRKAMACPCARQWRAHGDGSCKWGMGKAKIINGCRPSKFQLMTLTHNAFVLRTTHQPAKPVETNNTSHVFAAETIKAKPLNKNNPVNVEA